MAAVRQKKASKAIEPEAAPKQNVMILPIGHIELCAAKGDVRYYLNSPYLDMSEPKRPMLVATNGHVMAIAPVTIEGDVKPGPIPIKAMKAVRAVKVKLPQVGHRMIFEGDMCGTGDVMFRRQEGTFPDWRKLVEKLPKTTQYDVGVSGDYIAMLQNALAGTQKKYRGLAIYLPRNGKDIDPNSAIKVTSAHADCQDVIGIVMPMRI